MINSCWISGCGSPPAKTSSSVYCAAHWSSLTDHLQSLVHYLGAGAASIYVGRTNYPERRLLQHLANADRGHDRLAVLHWAGTPAEAEEIEKFVICVVKKRFKLKGMNESDDSDGRWSGPWNAVYASWREKKRTQAVPVIWHSVRDLDARPMAPVGGFLPFPVCLHAEVSPQDAQAALTARYPPRSKAR